MIATKPKAPSIAMAAVKSSQIDSMGHDPVTNTLAVKFKSGGATYHYHDVDAKKFADLQKAPSVGSHLHKHIKGVHKHTKV
jgi:hypothetical protein